MEQPKRKAFVLASINIDLTVSIKKCPIFGETIEGNNFLINAGGKGENTSIAIAKQNIPTYMIGNIGDDLFGEEIKEIWKKYKCLNTNYVYCREGEKTGTALILVENGQNRIVIVPGANKRMTEKQINEALENAHEKDVLISQLEINTDAVEYAFKIAKQKNMITVLNLAPAKKLNSDIFNNVDYLVVSKVDFENLTGTKINEVNINIYSCEQIYKNFGVKNLIILLGDYGTILVNKFGLTKKNAIKIKPIDNTACKCAFNGVFITQLLKGKSTDEALMVASFAAALTSQKRGAAVSIPTEEELIKFMESYE